MTTQTYDNELVHFTMQRKPSSIAEFEIEASAALAKTAYANAVKAICKQVVLPGFRKGRAPEPLVAKNYPNEINKKWQEEIALLTLAECQKISNTFPLQRDSKVNFSVKSLSKETGAKLTLAFEVEPEIPSVDPAKFTPQEVKRPEVSPEKIEETIRQIRFFYANWETISDRPAQEGDLVILDINMIDTEPEQPLFSNTRFEVTDNSMAQWMKTLVIGLSAGSSIEGVSTPDDSLPEEEKKQFQPKKVRLTLKTIEKAHLPPLDDAFAMNLGVKTVDDLHTQIEKLLNFKADGHVQEELRAQVSEFLLKEYPFDLPHSLIVKETQFRVKQLMQDPDFLKHWEGLNEEQQKTMIQTIHQQSEKAVRMFFICRKILSDAQITITPKDLPPPATTPLEMLLQTHQAPQAMNEMQQAEAYSRLILEKAQNFVIEHAKKS